MALTRWLGCPLSSWGCLVLLIASALLASDPDPQSADPLAEVPALPYLTVMLARDPAVQTELGLSSRQIGEVTAAVASIDNPLWQLRDVPVAQCGEKLAAYLATFQKALASTLSTRQRQRLAELILQARGAKGLLAPDTAARLELSEKQLAALRTRITELQQARKKSDQAAGTADRAQLEKAETKALLGELTAQQKTKLAKLLGKRFDLSRVQKIGCLAPDFDQVEDWINTAPLTVGSLRGKVVVVHFWAFNCINCIHNLPHYKSWYESFPKSDLTIIGIHTPETEAERELANLESKVKEYGIAYPIVFDRSAANWKLWGNHIWPSVYLVDRQGRVRSWWYGELNWQGARGEQNMRRQIEQLLAEQ